MLRLDGKVRTDLRHRGRRSFSSSSASRLHGWGWLLSLAIFLAVWQLVSTLFDVPSYILPSPSLTVGAIVRDSALLGQHLLATLAATLSGLALAAFAGLFAAILMNASRIIGEILYSHMVLSQAVPLIAIAPVILIWFGLGLFAKTVIVAAVCFFPIAVNTYEGFRTVQEEHNHLLTTFGATRWQRYRHLFVPATLPGIFAGLKIAATYSVLGAVVGEWLGGVRGMGIYMTRALQSFRTDRLFAAILVVMLTSFCLFKGVSLLGTHLTPWYKRR